MLFGGREPREVSPVPRTIGARKHIGISKKRTEDPLILMGKARYVDDISMPGMREVAFLRSSHAHAYIKSIHLDKAR